MKQFLLDYIESQIKDCNDKLAAISASVKLKGHDMGNCTAYFEEAAVKRTLQLLKYKVETYKEKNQERVTV